MYMSLIFVFWSRSTLLLVPVLVYCTFVFSTCVVLLLCQQWLNCTEELEWIGYSLVHQPSLLSPSPRSPSLPSPLSPSLPSPLSPSPRSPSLPSPLSPSLLSPSLLSPSLPHHHCHYILHGFQRVICVTEIKTCIKLSHTELSSSFTSSTDSNHHSSVHLIPNLTVVCHTVGGITKMN